jgi:hypothetical protein
VDIHMPGCLRKTAVPWNAIGQDLIEPVCKMRQSNLSKHIFTRTLNCERPGTLNLMYYYSNHYSSGK